MRIKPRSATGLIMVGFMTCAAVGQAPGDQAVDAGQERARRIAANLAANEVRREVAAMSRMIHSKPCPHCKGLGMARGARVAGDGFHIQSTPGPLEKCSVCQGTGRVHRAILDRKAAEEFGRRHRISAIVDIPVTAVASTYELLDGLNRQVFLERYAAFLELLSRRRDVVAADQQLADRIEDVKARALSILRTSSDVLEAVAYQLAKGSPQINGVAVLLIDRVEQLLTIGQEQFARVEYADHCWLIELPEGARYLEGSYITVVGRVLRDTEYVTVMGAGRTATVVAPLTTD